MLADLFDRASTPGFVVAAHGASFELRGLLKSRGYRWNSQGRVWERELDAAKREAEEFWLAANIYGPGADPTALGPEWRTVDWTSRYS